MFKENFGLIILALCFLFSVGSCTAYNINKDNILSEKGINCSQIYALTGRSFGISGCNDSSDKINE